MKNPDVELKKAGRDATIPSSRWTKVSCGIILGVILVAGLVIRLHIFYETHDIEDPAVDYLVAHHILSYGERPLNGPPSLSAISSPVYWYAVAGILAMHDAYRFPGFVNILFELATVVFVYMLAQRIFGRGTALAAASLFSFSGTLYQSEYLWRPTAMQPFLYVSFLFLYLAEESKRFLWLAASSFTFLFALVLHSSVAALLPLFAILATFVLRGQKKPTKYYLFYAIGAALVGLLFYSPFLIYLRSLPAGVAASAFGANNMFAPGFADFLSKVRATELDFWQYYFAGVKSVTVVAVFFTALSVQYFWRQPDEHKKIVAACLGIAVASSICAASLLNTGPMTNRYLAPVMGIFGMFAAEMLFGLLPSGWYFIPLKIGGFALILFTCVLGPARAVEYATYFGNPFRAEGDPGAWRALSENFHSLFNAAELGLAPYRPAPYIMPIRNEVMAIRRKEQLPDSRFFQFRFYRNIEEYPLPEAIVWIPLEEALGEKLTRVNDRDPRGYTPLNSDAYMFLICQDDPGTEDGYPAAKCLHAFVHDTPGYALPRQIFSESPYAVFVARKT